MNIKSLNRERLGKAVKTFWGNVRKLPPQRLVAAAGVLAFALVGLSLLVISHAATPTTSFEAEAGTRSGGATLASDSGASGGSAVKFGAAPATTMTMTVNGGTKYQAITALGASINSDSWNNGALKPVLDQLIDQNGTKNFRVVMEMMDWESTNDDADANNYNWSYYDPIYSGTTTFDTAQSGSNFANLWATIDYLHQRGIPDGQIILSFMGPGPSWLSGSKTNMAASKEDEFAELVVSAAYWGYSHGHTFGVFSPDNEADLTSNQEGIVMSASVYAASMNKIAARLDALGMSSVRLLGPETGGTNSSFVDAMEAYPALMAKVDHFDFHNYGGSTGNADSVIAGSGKDYWMSEFSIFDHAFSMLDEGAPGIMMWDAYDSVYNHAILNGLGSSPGNDAGNAPAWIAYNGSTKVYTPRKSFYQFGQLFKYTPLGAQRVDVTASNGMTLQAFTKAADGTVTIVGMNNTGSAQVIGGTLQNTPTATMLHYSQTTSSDNMKAGSDIAVSGGSFTTASIPNGAVFTLTTLPL